jgi:hypothetical protein
MVYPYRAAAARRTEGGLPFNANDLIFQAMIASQYYAFAKASPACS